MTRSRVALTAGVIAAISVVLASACAAPAAPSPTAAPAASAKPTANNPAAAAPTASNPAALSSTGAPAKQATGEPIKVGFFAPITGPVAASGADAKNAVAIALKQFNAAGGVNGRPIQIVEYDDRNDPKEAVSIANKLIQQDQVVAVLNGSYSSQSLAAAPVYSEAKVPMVAAYSNAYNVVNGKGYVFRAATVADVQGMVAANYFIKDLGKKKFAELEQNNEYGKGIMRGFEEGVKELGGEIVYKKTFDTSEQDFRPYLTAIKPLNVDVVFSSGFGSHHADAIRQGTELGVFPKALYAGGCDMSQNEWFTSAGKDGNGMIGILEFVAAGPGIDARTSDFVKEWKDTVKTAYVSHEAGLTYNAAALLFDAIKRGGPTREGINKALKDVKSFPVLGGATMTPSSLPGEMVYTMAIGKYNSSEQAFDLVKWETDPKLIDPAPWAKFYK